MKKLTLYILLIISTHIEAQDTIRLDIPIKFEVKGKQILSDRDAQIINGFGQAIADNPLRHFAIYGGITFKPNYNKKYSIDLGIFFEERNHSAGNNTLDHLVFYPRITFHAIDTIQILNSKLKFVATAGDLWNEEFNDIIRVYNLDFHGMITKIGYKNIWLSLYRAGDLSYNVGLGLNELSKIEVAYQKKAYTIGLQYSRNSLDSEPVADSNFGVYNKLILNKESFLKLQVEARTNDRIGNSIALGTEYKTEIGIHKIKLRYQYYDDRFNENYFSFDKVDYNTNFLNFTGTQFYPLKNYYRPINQWAFFTAFQNSTIHNFELNYTVKKDIYKSLYFSGLMDVNLLHQSLLDQWLLFPAFDIGLGVTARNFISIEVSGTNKHMNLNTAYQGHSLSESPYFSITLSMKS